MFNQLQILHNKSSNSLFTNCSIYSISQVKYEQYDILIEKYEALFNTLPFFTKNMPYLYDTGRDLYFYLSNKHTQLLESPSLSLIYVVRSTLLSFITSSTSFQKTMTSIQHDKELAFIYSTMLISALAEFHKQIHGVEEIIFEIRSTLHFKNIDLRTLFSEKYTTIEPYPKKIATLQQKLARLYINERKKNPQFFENLMEQAHLDLLTYCEINKFLPEGDA